MGKKHQAPSRAHAPIQPNFVSEAAEVRYAYISKRKFLCERGFQLTAAANMGYSAMIHSVISQHEWRGFAQHPDDAVVPLVREFCANIENDTTHSVLVRGISVNISPQAINAYYQLLEVEDEYFALATNPDPTFLQLVISTLCEPGTKWDICCQGIYTFTRTRLHGAAKVWYQMLQTRILPTSHNRTVSRDRAILLYCVLEGRRVNVGQIIFSELYTLSSQEKNTICLPSMISGLCVTSGVPFYEWEETLKMGGVFTSRTIAKLLKGKEPAEADDEDDDDDDDDDSRPPSPPLPRSRSVPAAKGSTSSNSAFSSFLHKQVKKLHKMYKKLVQERDTIFTHVGI